MSLFPLRYLPIDRSIHLNDGIYFLFLLISKELWVVCLKKIEKKKKLIVSCMGNVCKYFCNAMCQRKYIFVCSFRNAVGGKFGISFGEFLFYIG